MSNYSHKKRKINTTKNKVKHTKVNKMTLEEAQKTLKKLESKGDKTSQYHNEVKYRVNELS